MCEKTQNFLLLFSLSLLRVRDATTRQTKGEGKEEEFSFSSSSSSSARECFVCVRARVFSLKMSFL